MRCSSNASRSSLVAGALALASCINTSHELELSPGFDRIRKEPRVPLALSLSIQTRSEGEGKRELAELREEDEHDARKDFVGALERSGRFSRIAGLKRSGAAGDSGELELRVDLVEIAPARGNFAAAGFLFYLFPVTLHERETLHATARARDGREHSYDLADQESEVYWLPLLPVGLVQIACGVDAREGAREHLARILVDHLEQDGLLTPRGAHESPPTSSP